MSISNKHYSLTVQLLPRETELVLKSSLRIWGEEAQLNLYSLLLRQAFVCFFIILATSLITKKKIQIWSLKLLPFRFQTEGKFPNSSIGNLANGTWPIFQPVASWLLGYSRYLLLCFGVGGIQGDFQPWNASGERPWWVPALSGESWITLGKQEEFQAAQG